MNKLTDKQCEAFEKKKQNKRQAIFVVKYLEIFNLK